MSASFLLADRLIGDNCFIIAEAGVNHNGDPKTALALIDAAAETGADAVKFQTFSADRLAVAAAPKAHYQMTSTSAESQREMLRKLEIDEPTHRMLINRAASRGIIFLSSPFDEESADLLDRIGICAFKIPSGELTNHAFIQHVARKGKPMIVSTGMADLSEVSMSVGQIRATGLQQFALLHCVSSYPAAPEDANLRAIMTLAREFHVPAGWSDHMLGVDVAIAATALGATIIEKHFTLDRHAHGPDHSSSLEPVEFAGMVQSIRRVASALGTGVKQPRPAEAEIASVARKSLCAREDLAAGHVIKKEDLVALRPGTGIPPFQLELVIGRRIIAPLLKGELLVWENI